MERILITGASGALGREVIAQLKDQPYRVRLMQHRTTPPGGLPDQFEMAKADLESGEGLLNAVSDVDIVIHLASRGAKTEAPNTDRLLKAAHGAGVSHFIYQSIVGIDRIPFSYYKAKLAAEDLIRAGNVPWTIFRATQFHTLLDLYLKSMSRFPVLIVPRNFQFQPLDPAEAAARLIEAVQAGPSGYWSELGGPLKINTREITTAWLSAQGLRKPVIYLPLPGKVARSFRQGYNTTSVQPGTISWQDWLQRHK